MKQDIRDLMKDFKEKKATLSKNHHKKFDELLRNELHQKSNRKTAISWLSIAASIILLITVGLQFQTSENIERPIQGNSGTISLGSISPEFQTLETYYTNSIALELSEIELNDENQEMVDGYLVKIGELTQEYKSLTQELNTKGVNDATIDALMSNLQLRLQLLKRLKKQLNELKNLNTQKNELQII